MALRVALLRSCAEWVRAKRDVGPAALRLFLQETAPHD